MELDQFKESFIEEALDFVKQLEAALLDLETNSKDAENISLVFRVLHTLKGVSSMYGFDHISELVHDLESIFEYIREGKQDLTNDLFEIMLDIVDHLRNLLADEKMSEPIVQQKQTDLLENIAVIAKGMSIGVTVVKSKSSSHPILTDKATYYIIYYPTENQLFRGVNILRMFEELAELGEFRVVNHSFQEHTQDHACLPAWGIYCVTDKSIDDIEDIFMFVLDDCKILQVSRLNLFNSTEFVEKLAGLKEDAEVQVQKEKRNDLAHTIEAINTSIPIQTSVEQNSDTLTDQKIIADESTAQQIVEELEVSSNKQLKEVGKQLTSRISIDASKLDRLMYLVSELVITKSQLNSAVETQDYQQLTDLAEKIDDLSRHFRDNALKIRLVPVSEMVVPFKRMIRDLSKQLGKEISFMTQGVDAELDKSIIDRLAEPIMHILRNSVDHGIESPDVREANHKSREGCIKFTSYYSGANVFIQIQDDGAGMDPAKLRIKAIEKGIIKPDDQLTEKEAYDLIFRPGFSTAAEVTDISGRGVGMDVVRRKIAEVRGEVEVNSEIGLGTFITIKLHQTLSIIDTLLLQVENAFYLVPVAEVEFCDQEQHEFLYRTENRQYEVKDELIPFISLRDIFHPGTKFPRKEKVIVINKNEKRIAIVVDKIIGEHQAVLKPLGKVLQEQDYLSGASILGDGALALMLDTAKLLSKPPLILKKDLV